jgi:type II secretion system protein N
VKRIGRILLWIIGTILVLGCILLLATNLYVQSQGTHRRIQQELSERLGTPLRLRQISITPWSGLQLNGITIPQEPEKLGGNFLEARSFQLRVKFLSLFSDHLVIRRVMLNRPVVVWAQNSAGKWRLPELPPPKKKSPPRVAGAPAASESTVSPVAPPSLAPPLSSPEESSAVRQTAPVFTPEVQRVTLKDGDFTFLASNGRLIAKFSGLDFSSAFRTATALKGNVRVEKISLRDRFFLEELQSPLHYDPSELAFSNISAQAAGGNISGKFEMQLQAADSPFTADVKFRDLQADKLLSNAGGPLGMLQGRVEGFLEASGKTADPNALNGHGAIVLRDGKLQQYSLLVALGQILQIDELMQLQLEQAEVKYHINPGIVTVDALVLRSANIRLTATGTISFSGKLHLDAQLALNDKIRRQLFAPIRENFVPLTSPAGYAAVDFKVNGTVERPKTNLMDKLVGRDLRDLGGVISSLFGHAKKKKPRPEPTPSPAPAVSPNENVEPAASAAPTLAPSPEAASSVSPAPSPASSPAP